MTCWLSGERSLPIGLLVINFSSQKTWHIISSMLGFFTSCIISKRYTSKPLRMLKLFYCKFGYENKKRINWGGGGVRMFSLISLNA